jgi:hypothetical protein
MINTDIPNLTIYYSEYGYIQVDKDIVLDPDKQVVSFSQVDRKISGSLNVTKY